MTKGIYSSLLFSLFTTIGLSQNQFTVTIKGQIVNSKSDTLKLVQNDGHENKLIASIPLSKKGTFEKKVTLTDKDYYLLQLDDSQTINLIINGNKPIEIDADGKDSFNSIKFKDSEENASLNSFLLISAVYKKKLDSVNQYLQANKDKEQQIKQDFQPIYDAFLVKRSQFMTENADSPALIATLSSLNLENEFSTYKTIVDDLNKSFGESPTIQRIAKQFIANEAIIKSRQPLGMGSDEIDIALPDPAGDTLRLSDYKGHYVLLDFWASWCGPCRRENPNVVKMYNKYKDKGFVIFSVSLDKDNASWKRAIEQDGLVWKTHVSDLKYWSSAPAQAYKVHSIPHSFLIDPNGKIIDQNLRGEGLENKLKEIYGE